jgi:hypothetical protein
MDAIAMQCYRSIYSFTTRECRINWSLKWQSNMMKV